MTADNVGRDGLPSSVTSLPTPLGIGTVWIDSSGMRLPHICGDPAPSNGTAQITGPVLIA